MNGNNFAPVPNLISLSSDTFYTARDLRTNLKNLLGAVMGLYNGGSKHPLITTFNGMKITYTPLRHDWGICNHIPLKQLKLFKKCVSQWDQYSGVLTYPIHDNQWDATPDNPTRAPASQYITLRDAGECWKTNNPLHAGYVTLRIDLLNQCINILENNIKAHQALIDANVNHAR